VTPAQCSAARKLLNWSSNRLAERSGVAATTVIAFERNEKRTNPSIVRALRETLADQGIVFDAAETVDPQAWIKQCTLSDGSLVRLTREPSAR